MEECEVQEEEGRLQVEFAGLTCVAFSPLGKGEGLAHDSMRPFFVWASLQRSCRPALLVIESAAKFLKDLLKWFLEDLCHLEFFDHPGPTLHGWPITRPRMYCLGILRSKFTFFGSSDEYFSLFRLHGDGDAFFFLGAEDEEVQREHESLMKKRYMQGTPPSHDWGTIYPFGKQKILSAHKDKFVEKRGRSSDAHIVDLDQNVQFASAGKNWPCLVRHGCIYSFRKQRHACPSEIFAAQGFPVRSGLFVTPHPCWQNFYQLQKAVTSATAWHKLAGNAMFVPTLGSMIMYALASIEPQAARIVRPMSWYVEDEDSQQPMALDGLDL